MRIFTANTFKIKFAVFRGVFEGRSCQRDLKMQNNAENQQSRRRSRAEKDNRRMKLERGAVYAAFCVGLFATFLFLIAVCSDHWVTVTYSSSQWRNDTGRGGPFYKTGHYHGLWRICRQEYVNETADVDPYNSWYYRTAWENFSSNYLTYAVN